MMHGPKRKNTPISYGSAPKTGGKPDTGVIKNMSPAKKFMKGSKPRGRT